MIKPNTFGKFPAANILVDIINENGDSNNRRLLSQISKCTTGFNTVLKELEKIDANIAISIVKSIYPEYREIALSLSGKYGTYTANVVKSIKNQWMNSKKNQKK